MIGIKDEPEPKCGSSPANGMYCTQEEMDAVFELFTDGIQICNLCMYNPNSGSVVVQTENHPFFRGHGSPEYKRRI